eukprot:1395439-Amorphochlora_amoeboformis.AAC.1
MEEINLAKVAQKLRSKTLLGRRQCNLMERASVSSLQSLRLYVLCIDRDQSEPPLVQSEIYPCLSSRVRDRIARSTLRPSLAHDNWFI